MTKRWQFRRQGTTGSFKENGVLETFPQAVLDAADGSPLLASLLAGRGFTEPKAIQEFLELGDYQPTSGWELPDMTQGVERILLALERQESILIYGDFDVDGITGTSILYETFKQHLKAKVSFYIPDRATEGHGLNTAALVRLTSMRQTKLVITTDTGITNFPEVSLLKGLGIDTIITDHHALPENLPPAVANINGQRLERTHPLADLCGAGVAYKLCEILLQKCLPEKDAREIAESLLDIVAVGTVVDMVPLVRENRYLVYRGLQVLNQRQRPGFQEVLTQAGVAPEAVINSETLGFTIGPRLNALGRLEKADDGVELLTSHDTERIRIIAAHLEFLNRQRRELCDQTFLEAESHLQQNGGLGGERAIILASPGWNPGIIGIVASRLLEKYHVPVFMMKVEEAKGEVRCSARSIPGFNLYDAMLELSDYFIGFGGHSGAGGFSLKLSQLAAFKEALYALCRRTIPDELMQPLVEVDAQLSWNQINPHLLSLVDRLAPFGMSNPSPKFLIDPVHVINQRGMGEDERHLKLSIIPAENKQDLKMGPVRNGMEVAMPLDGIIWNFGRQTRFELQVPYGMVVVPSLNTFNGSTKVQLLIDDYQLKLENSQEGSASSKPASPEQRRPSASRTSATTQPQRISTGSFSPALTRSEGARSEGVGSESNQTGLNASKGNSSENQEVHWIDHRHREAVDEFLGQLMTPNQASQWMIYHEGKKTRLPFLDEVRFCTRQEVQKAEELVFWDLPPSPTVFYEVIKAVQPAVIHWVGGKYQAQSNPAPPLFPSPENYLKLILQTMYRQELAVQQVNLADFATQLATSDAIILQGLILLQKMGVLNATLNTVGQEGIEIQLTEPRLTTLNGSLIQTSQSLEYLCFQHALKEVGKFRGWLFSSPLATIRSVLFASHQEENPYGHHTGTYSH